MVKYNRHWWGSVIWHIFQNTLAFWKMCLGLVTNVSQQVGKMFSDESHNYEVKLSGFWVQRSSGIIWDGFLHFQHTEGAKKKNYVSFICFELETEEVLVGDNVVKSVLGFTFIAIESRDFEGSLDCCYLFGPMVLQTIIKMCPNCKSGFIPPTIYCRMCIWKFDNHILVTIVINNNLHDTHNFEVVQSDMLLLQFLIFLGDI